LNFYASGVFNFCPKCSAWLKPEATIGRRRLALARRKFPAPAKDRAIYFDETAVFAAALRASREGCPRTYTYTYGRPRPRQGSDI
jgi:hypothetical protein